MNGIISVGVTFGDADPATRRALALDPARAARVRAALAGSPGLESVLVATCHRTEIVFAGAALTPADAIAGFHHAVVDPADVALCLQANPRVFVGDDAVAHLFAVACGLDSALLGDAEILGQLRAAWHAAEAAGTTGPTLRRLFRDAFAVGRRARATTAIAAGGAGIGSAAAAVIAERPGRVLLVGAGEAATSIGRRLAKSGRPLTVVNRTVARAEQLARELGGRVAHLAELAPELAVADVVVCAVGAPTPVLGGGVLRTVRSMIAGWDPLIVDAGSPPGVEPTPGFDIVGLDTLAARAAARDARRRSAITSVESLVREASKRFVSHVADVGAVQTSALQPAVARSGASPAHLSMQVQSGAGSCGC